MSVAQMHVCEDTTIRTHIDWEPRLHSRSVEDFCVFRDDYDQGMECCFNPEHDHPLLRSILEALFDEDCSVSGIVVQPHCVTIYHCAALTASDIEARVREKLRL